MAHVAPVGGAESARCVQSHCIFVRLEEQEPLDGDTGTDDRYHGRPASRAALNFFSVMVGASFLRTDQRATALPDDFVQSSNKRDISPRREIAVTSFPIGQDSVPPWSR